MAIWDFLLKWQYRNINISVNALDALAQSPELWSDMTALYASFLDKRISSSFLGYEETQSFRDGANVFLAESQRLSPTWEPIADRDPEIKTGIDSLSQQSLEANLNKFDEFYNKHLKNDPVFRGKSKSEILQVLAAINYRFYRDNPEQWRLGWHFTYIFPFCKPGNRLPSL